jgi:hypothetical protein
LSGVVGVVKSAAHQWEFVLTQGIQTKFVIAMAKIRIDAMILVVHLKLQEFLADGETKVHDLCVPDCDE